MAPLVRLPPEREQEFNYLYVGKSIIYESGCHQWLNGFVYQN